MQVKESRSQRRVEDDRDSEHERDKETPSHVGLHLAGHRRIAHIMAHPSRFGHRMTSGWALLHCFLRLHLMWWSDLSWMDCAGCVLSMLDCGGGPCSDGERLPAGEATVLDQLPQLLLRHRCLVVGNRHRLSDVTGLDGANWRKLAQSLL